MPIPTTRNCFYLRRLLSLSVKNFMCLLIDDDVDDREIFCAVLEVIDHSYPCLTAANGKIALDMLNGHSTLPEAIFLDVNMPLMNGRQFLQEINRLAILNQVPVFVLSTSADANTKDAMIKLGAKLYYKT